jgi:hypothetical protein
MQQGGPTVPSVQYYSDLSDDELLDAAKYGPFNREVFMAVTERLDEALMTLGKFDFRQWQNEGKINELSEYLAIVAEVNDDLLTTIRDLRNEIDKLKGVNQ